MSASRRSWPVRTSWSTYSLRTRLTVHSGPAQSSSGGCERLGDVIGPLPLASPVDDPVVHGERLSHDLIHVVVLVRRQAADELDLGRRVGELLVAPVDERVLRTRDRVVRVALRTRVARKSVV